MADHLSPSVAIIAAAVWLLLFVIWQVRIRRRWFDRSAQEVRPYPEALLRGMILVALGPATSVIHYLASGGQAFWGGAVILLTGLALIAVDVMPKRRQPDDEGPFQQTTFREKMVLAQFAGVLLVFAIFGVKLWSQPLSPGNATRVLMAAAVLLIIVNVLAQIAVRIFSSVERADERDLAIARQGTRNAYYVLGFGVWGILVFATAPAFQPHLFYVLVGALALAELVRLGSQLLYYRIGT